MAAELPEPEFEFAVIDEFELRWLMDGPQPDDPEEAMMAHVRTFLEQGSGVRPISRISFQLGQVIAGKRWYWRAVVRVALGV